MSRISAAETFVERSWKRSLIRFRLLFRVEGSGWLRRVFALHLQIYIRRLVSTAFKLISELNNQISTNDPIENNMQREVSRVRRFVSQFGVTFRNDGILFFALGVSICPLSKSP